MVSASLKYQARNVPFKLGLLRGEKRGSGNITFSLRLPMQPGKALKALRHHGNFLILHELQDSCNDNRYQD